MSPPGSLPWQSAIIHVSPQYIHVLYLAGRFWERLEILPKQLTDETFVGVWIQLVHRSLSPLSQTKYKHQYLQS